MLVRIELNWIEQEGSSFGYIFLLKEAGVHVHIRELKQQLKKWIWAALNFIALYPSHLICLMSAKISFFEVEF